MSGMLHKQMKRKRLMRKFYFKEVILSNEKIFKRKNLFWIAKRPFFFLVIIISITDVKKKIEREEMMRKRLME